MDGASLADVVEELQSVRVDLAALAAQLQALQAQAHADALAIVAVGALLLGAALGLAAAVCCRGWFGGRG